MLRYKAILIVMLVPLSACVVDNRRSDIFRERNYTSQSAPQPAPSYTPPVVNNHIQHYHPQPYYPQIKYPQPYYPPTTGYRHQPNYRPNYQQDYYGPSYRSKPKDTRGERSEVHKPISQPKNTHNYDSRRER